MICENITKQIIGAAFAVHNELGAGFLEAVYQNALAIVIRERGLQLQKEHPLSVSFHGQVVGQYYADLFVENQVIVELKAVSTLASAHKAQVIHYLKATGIEVGILLNFGSSSLQDHRLENHQGKFFEMYPHLKRL